MKSTLIPMAFLLLVARAEDLWAVTPPAKVAYVEGTVLIKKKGDDKPVPAELGQSLFYGDQVKTLGGKCQINMTASGILRLSPNTTVAFPAEGNHGDKISVVRMLQGKTMQNIENLWKDEVFEVRTPSLVAGMSDGEASLAAWRGARISDGGGNVGAHNQPIERNISPANPTAPGEQARANLPTEFDLRPIAVSKRGYDLEVIAPEMVFRFRGRSVSVKQEFKLPVDPSGASGGVQTQDYGKYELNGTFVDGILVGTGSLVKYTRDVAQGVDFAEVHCDGSISGVASDDGKLVVKCQWTPVRAQTSEASARADVPGWIWGKRIPWPGELRRPREIEVTLQLPVAATQPAPR